MRLARYSGHSPIGGNTKGQAWKEGACGWAPHPPSAPQTSHLNFRMAVDQSERQPLLCWPSRTSTGGHSFWSTHKPLYTGPWILISDALGKPVHLRHWVCPNSCRLPQDVGIPWTNPTLSWRITVFTKGWIRFVLILLQIFISASWRRVVYSFLFRF